MTSKSTGTPGKDALRYSFAFIGTAGIICGILILGYLHENSVVASIVAGIYALIAGAFYVLLSLFGRDVSKLGRAGDILIGAALIAVGIIALVLTGRGSAPEEYELLGIAFGVTWIVEGLLCGLAYLRKTAGWWSLVVAIAFIVAGVLMLVAFAWISSVQWAFLGWALLILGFVQFFRLMFSNRK